MNTTYLLPDAQERLTEWLLTPLGEQTVLRATLDRGAPQTLGAGKLEHHGNAVFYILTGSLDLNDPDTVQFELEIVLEPDIDQPLNLTCAIGQSTLSARITPECRLSWKAPLNQVIDRRNHRILPVSVTLSDQTQSEDDFRA